MQLEKRHKVLKIMRIRFKNIQNFFLMLAWLVMMAHLVIPHDHHQAESINSQDSTCPVSDNNSGHHSGLPIHCNAFNNLAEAKLPAYSFINNIHLNDILSQGYHDASDFSIPAISISFPDLPEPFADYHLLEFSPLRAPPVQC